MIQMIAITFDDDSLGIMSFHTRPRLPGGVVEREATKEAVDAEIAKSAFDRPVKSWRLIDPEEIPQSRAYRGAWVDDGGIKHDMERARDIHRITLRRERAKHLTALDVDYARADEAGDTSKKREVAARKQKLRDVTAHPSIAAASTVEELAALTLDELSK